MQIIELYVWYGLIFGTYKSMESVLRKRSRSGSSLVVQWLGVSAFTAVGLGSVPNQGTKIPQAAQHSQKTKKKKT